MQENDPHLIHSETVRSFHMERFGSVRPKTGCESLKYKKIPLVRLNHFESG